MKAAQQNTWAVTALLVRRDDPGGAADVERLRELRARILFDRGRRPDFRAADGRHVDDQDLDFGAWHFVATAASGGEPLGYVRLAPPELHASFQSRAFLGADAYQRLLDEHGLDPARVYEHSRLVVEHRARKLGLGIHLNATAIAAARCLGAVAMTGTSGTKDGQDLFHERFGFRPVPGTRRYVDRYTEDVVLMLHLCADGVGEHEELAEALREDFRALRQSPSKLPGLRRTAPQRPGPEVATALPGPRRDQVPPTQLLSGPHAHQGPLDPADPASSWQPLVLRAGDDEGDREALSVLLESGAVHAVHDTLADQLVELVRSREPALASGSPAVARAVSEQLAGREPWAYGSWVFYPWSGRLVHLLPREEFRLVRTDRNRGRIDRPEQRRLFDRRIGVIGLSVGSSAALTLAQEGVGGAFRLADFDELSLSNLNRLRAGVHDLGVNKAVLAARQMFEIDPYLDIEIHRAGLTEDSMKEFFVGAGDDPLDLLVEECDAPWVKLAAREQARALGVPVVMDANDRGLLDVERFDEEPDRPLLHGILGATAARDLSGPLSAQETIELILRMVDEERISPELAAAIPHIGSSLSSWPQLASGVALGGALVTDAARRILLGRPCTSGRYYTDLQALLAPDRRVLT
jgi:hypothetical protein